MSTENKFELFKKLHTAGNPLVLYNIWDAGSAQAVAESGAPAIATGSKPLALSQGYPDGEVISLERVIDMINHIMKVVKIPVSIDFEGGYSKADNMLLEENTARLLETGIIGVNFEDQIIGKEGIHEIDTQAKRIAVIRKTAKNSNTPLFINARTDLFLHEKAKDKHAYLIEEAKVRAQAYKEAGANGFFAPGLDNPELITDLCASIDLPVNILNLPTAPDNQELAKCGVARISYGPYAYLELMNTLRERSSQHMTIF